MIKVVVAGSGYWGKNLVRNFHVLGALAGICDKDPRVLQKLHEMYDEVPIVQSFDDLFAESAPPAAASPSPPLQKTITNWQKRLYRPESMSSWKNLSP